VNKLLALTGVVTLAGCSSVDTQVPKVSIIDTQKTEINEWYSQGQNAVAQRLATRINTNKAKNVILFIADGMGISTITLRVFMMAKVEASRAKKIVYLLSRSQILL
jgi:alkaline phosphatase